MLLRKAEQELLWDTFKVWNNTQEGSLLQLMHIRMGCAQGAAQEDTHEHKDISRMSDAELTTFYMDSMKTAGYNIDLASIVNGYAKKTE